MTAVGLLPFARVALEVATAVLPPYRSPFSKHQFTQPPFERLRAVSEVERLMFVASSFHTHSKVVPRRKINQCFSP